MVNYREDIRRRINERVESVNSRYILTGHSIRKLSEFYKVSKSTVHADLKYRGPKILPYDITSRVERRVASNIKETRKYGHTLNYNKDFQPDLRLDRDLSEDSYNDMPEDYFDEEELLRGYEEYLISIGGENE